MLRRESDSHGLFSSGETSDNDCEMGASCGEVDVVCLCEAGPCTLYSEAHTPTPTPLPKTVILPCRKRELLVYSCHDWESGGFGESDITSVTCWKRLFDGKDTLLCEHCGKNRVMITRYSEGYGTEEECVFSDPQGESDADADIEDTDCRLQEPGSLQRISSRRRKRPRVARQDTTESEDDGGRSHRSHRWNLRLSPDRAHSRTILEESISQVRPLVICRPSERQKSPVEVPRGSRRLMSLLPSSLSLPLILLLTLPLSLSLVIVIVSFFLPWASA